MHRTLIIICILHLFICCGYAQKDSLHIVYFDSNIFIPSVEEQYKLEGLINAGLQIRTISGHTDSVGSRQSNKQLSSRRAEEVRKFFEARSIRINDSEIFFFGEDSIASLHDNSKNRRVEIWYRVLPAPEMVAKPEPGIDSAIKILERRSFDKIYFLPDRAVIDPASYQYVADLLRYIQSYPDKKFEIRGHVNLSRRFNRNPESEFFQRMQKLSEDRARLIYEILVEKGISSDRLRYRGMGNQQMVIPDARTEPEMRKNMRVEVFVYE